MICDSRSPVGLIRWCCDQYTVQGDLFSQSILEDKEPPIPLEQSIKNMAVIETIFRSAKSGKWEAPLNPGL